MPRRRTCIGLTAGAALLALVAGVFATSSASFLMWGNSPYASAWGLTAASIDTHSESRRVATVSAIRSSVENARDPDSTGEEGANDDEGHEDPGPGRQGGGRGPVHKRRKVHKCRKLLHQLQKESFSVHLFVNASWGVEPLAVASLLPALPQAESLLHCRKHEPGQHPPRVVIVDVGANDGVDTPAWVALAQRLSTWTTPLMSNGSRSRPCVAAEHRTTATLYLVEPQASYLPALRRVANSAAVSGRANVTVVHAAIGTAAQHDTRGAVIASAQQAKVSPVLGTQAENVAIGSGTILFKHLPLMLAEAGEASDVYIDVLKVDCEGADASIVVAQAPLLRAHRIGVVVMELNRRQGDFSASHLDAAGALESAGYTLLLFGKCPAATATDAEQVRFVRVTASGLRHFYPALETLVALAPSVADAASVTDGPLAPSRRSAAGLRSCAKWFVDMPCNTHDGAALCGTVKL
jgi:hypothetical protein